MSSMVQAASVPDLLIQLKWLKMTGLVNYSQPKLLVNFKEMGYNIEYVSAGALPQHPGIARVIFICKLKYGQIMLEIYIQA